MKCLLLENLQHTLPSSSTNARVQLTWQLHTGIPHPSQTLHVLPRQTAMSTSLREGYPKLELAVSLRLQQKSADVLHQLLTFLEFFSRSVQLSALQMLPPAVEPVQSIVGIVYPHRSAFSTSGQKEKTTAGVEEQFPLPLVESV